MSEPIYKDNKEQGLKAASKIAVAALGLLLIGAFVFYKDRAFFADSAYILFHIVRNKSLMIQEHRFGSFITQIVPLIGAKLHLSLKAIIIAYTTSFNFFYLITVSILVWGLKQYKLAILMALYYFLFISDSYYWTNNEIHQAIAWMFLFFGTIIYAQQKQLNKFLSFPIILVLGFLAVFTHVVVIIPTTFLWMYLLLDNREWKFSRSYKIIISILLACIIVTKFTYSYFQPYDGKILGNATKISISDLLITFKKPIVTSFLHDCLVNYFVAIIIFTAGLVKLIQEKKKLLSAFVFCSTLMYFVIMGLAYAGGLLKFHAESEWASLSIIIAAPFVFSVLPGLKVSRAVTVMVLIFALRIYFILGAAHLFTWRTHFTENILVQMKKKNITKLALEHNDDINRQYILDWGLKEESILMSAMSDGLPAATFFFKDGSVSDEQLANKTDMIASWTILPPKDMNPEYLAVDTTRPYTVMSYDELIK